MLTIDKNLNLGIEKKSVKFPMSESCFRDLFYYIKEHTEESYKDISRVNPVFRIFYAVKDNVNLEVLMDKNTKDVTFSFSQFKKWKGIRNVGKITIYEKITLKKEQVLDLFRT